MTYRRERTCRTGTAVVYEYMVVRTYSGKVMMSVCATVTSVFNTIK